MPPEPSCSRASAAAELLPSDFSVHLYGSDWVLLLQSHGFVAPGLSFVVIKDAGMLLHFSEIGE